MHTFLPRFPQLLAPLASGSLRQDDLRRIRVARQRWHGGARLSRRAAPGTLALCAPPPPPPPPLGQTPPGTPGPAARRVRGRSGHHPVTSSHVLAGSVASASPPTLSSHKLPTATANHSRRRRPGAR